VDGKPRFDGVRDFLSSRNIELPKGQEDDSPDAETVAGLGNRKNDLVNRIIDDAGVEPYTGTVQLIHQLRRDGFRLAVVTSSENCSVLLKSTHLDAYFDTQVDGRIVHARNLAGKPAPDSFLLAAQLLGVPPARAVIVEDAIAGVQAGSNGRFGLVIGVARVASAEDLRRHGAHLVVNDLAELVDSEHPAQSV
jgi:HAD superfamily hydrolase (TIGR01509 family)